MVQDRPVGVSALDEHRQRAAERKSRRSIEVMPVQTGSSPQPEKASAGPSQKSKKRAGTSPLLPAPYADAPSSPRGGRGG